nr:hypothetical protein [Agrobacterium vitis]
METGYLVKIQIRAISPNVALVLLNEDISTLIKSFEIIEMIDDTE